MIINGTQIDIKRIFIFNTKSQIGYQHIYYVHNNYVSNDLSGYSDQNKTDPCDSNPCQNGGTCLLGYNNTISCLCPQNYNGD
jgi:hypothetical protein